MTSTFPQKPLRIFTSAPTDLGVSGRRFATLMTVGAAVLALFLATALPARADRNDDLAKALIAALVIGAIVHETKRDDPPPAVVPPPEPVGRARVPQVCAIEIDGSERSVTLYAESCLRREGITQRLPRGCASDARIFGREDRVYGTQCLRDAGFRVSGR